VLPIIPSEPRKRHKNRSIWPTQRKHLETVLHGVKQLRSMIDNPLEITRAKSRKMRIEPRYDVTGDEVDTLGSA
jgi:hypothetical protein